MLYVEHWTISLAIIIWQVAFVKQQECAVMLQWNNSDDMSNSRITVNSLYCHQALLMEAPWMWGVCGTSSSLIVDPLNVVAVVIATTTTTIIAKWPMWSCVYSLRPCQLGVCSYHASMAKSASLWSVSLAMVVKTVGWIHRNGECLFHY